MGHAFQHTIMDALTRYHRMRGFNTLWQPGTDHAGIATQIVVERQLEAQGIDRHDDRARGVRRARLGVEGASRARRSLRQMRRLGASCDWAREYFTMDEELSRAVTEVFVRLYEQGLIYRGKRLVNWDPVLQTAVSDLEVESEEEDGELWHIRYPRSTARETQFDRGGRDDAPRDDAGRHRGRGAPGGRALPALIGKHGRAAA